MYSACGGQTIGTSRFTEKYPFTAISDKGRQPFCQHKSENGRKDLQRKRFYYVLLWSLWEVNSNLEMCNKILNCKNVQFSNTSFDWFTVMKCYEEWSGQIKGFWLGATSRDHCNHIGRWKSIFVVETDIWKTFWNVGTVILAHSSHQPFNLK